MSAENEVVLCSVQINLNFTFASVRHKKAWNTAAKIIGHAAQ